MDKPQKAQLFAVRLAKLAESIRDFASPEEKSEGNLEEESLDNKIWNLDTQDEVVPPTDINPGTQWSGPQPQREDKKPVLKTVDIRPPRGVRR